MLKNNGFHNRHSPILRAFSPLSLFSGGAPGAWYDPSDLTTLFQDSAGTTPVTAVEQPVGRMLDKSGYGNHAFQATSASRPVLSARVNLLTKTEQFDDAVWTKTALNPFGSGSVANTTATTDPLGGNTADFIQENTSLSEHRVISASAVTVVSGSQNKSVIHAKQAVGSRYLVAYQLTGTVGWSAYVDLSTGALVSSVAIGGGVGSASVESAGNGWYKVSVTLTAVGTSVHFSAGLSNGTTPSYTGNGTSGIYIWGADFRPTNQGVGLPAYQRVNTSTDYNTVGFLPFLKFDGIDDSLSTNSISFTSTDKMSVFAGVRKLSDAAIGMLYETGNNNTGAVFLAAPITTGVGDYRFRSAGSLSVDVNTGALYAAPRTDILTGLSDISGDLATLRINGSQVAQNTSNQGTGNYGNYPLYIGRRGGSSLPFNGQMYSMIIVGKAVTAGELSSTETYVNQKTGAY